MDIIYLFSNIVRSVSMKRSFHMRYYDNIAEALDKAVTVCDKIGELSATMKVTLYRSKKSKGDLYYENEPVLLAMRDQLDRLSRANKIDAEDAGALAEAIRIIETEDLD